MVFHNVGESRFILSSALVYLQLMFRAKALSTAKTLIKLRFKCHSTIAFCAYPSQPLVNSQPPVNLDRSERCDKVNGPFIPVLVAD
jgi:hypothetical protein